MRRCLAGSPDGDDEAVRVVGAEAAARTVVDADGVTAARRHGVTDERVLAIGAHVVVVGHLGPELVVERQLRIQARAQLAGHHQDVDDLSRRQIHLEIILIRHEVAGDLDRRSDYPAGGL